MDERTENYRAQDSVLEGDRGTNFESPGVLATGLRQQFRTVICQRQAYYEPFPDGGKIPVDLLYGPILENGIQYHQIRFSEGGRVQDIKVPAQSLKRITYTIPVPPSSTSL